MEGSAGARRRHAQQSNRAHQGKAAVWGHHWRALCPRSVRPAPPQGRWPLLARDEPGVGWPWGLAVDLVATTVALPAQMAEMAVRASRSTGEVAMTVVAEILKSKPDPTVTPCAPKIRAGCPAPDGRKGHWRPAGHAGCGPHRGHLHRAGLRSQDRSLLAAPLPPPRCVT